MRKLLEFRRSPNCVKVRIALRYKGLDFETEEMSAADRGPLLAAANWPLVPVLIDDDVALGDSEAILIYLESRYREPSLAIPDADTLKQAQQLVAALNGHYAGLRPQLAGLLKAPAEERTEAALEAVQASASALLAPLAARLAERPFLFDERPTIYDVVCACMLMPMRPPASFVEASPFWRSFVGLMRFAPEHERVRAWYESLMAHDGHTAFA